MDILYINKFNDNALNIRPNPLYKVIYIYAFIFDTIYVIFLIYYNV